MRLNIHGKYPYTAENEILPNTISLSFCPSNHIQAGNILVVNANFCSLFSANPILKFTFCLHSKCFINTSHHFKSFIANGFIRLEMQQNKIYRSISLLIKNPNSELKNNKRKCLLNENKIVPFAQACTEQYLCPWQTDANKSLASSFHCRVKIFMSILISLSLSLPFSAYNSVHNIIIFHSKNNKIETLAHKLPAFEHTNQMKFISFHLLFCDTSHTRNYAISFGCRNWDYYFFGLVSRVVVELWNRLKRTIWWPEN